MRRSPRLIGTVGLQCSHSVVARCALPTRAWDAAASQRSPLKARCTTTPSWPTGSSRSRRRNALLTQVITSLQPPGIAHQPGFVDADGDAAVRGGGHRPADALELVRSASPACHYFFRYDWQGGHVPDDGNRAPGRRFGLGSRHTTVAYIKALGPMRDRILTYGRLTAGLVR